MPRWYPESGSVLMLVTEISLNYVSCYFNKHCMNISGIAVTSRQQRNGKDTLLSISSRLISSGDGDASDDTSSPTGASAEPLDAALTSSTFSSAGESGLSVTTTAVEEAEAGSSDGTGSGTAALAQRQPEAEKKISKQSAVRKRIRASDWYRASAREKQTERERGGDS